ncbi:MAG: AAA family ATPase [Burkholderiaceae bacterium]|nr:AAA family ATPase [Burkholderiaceae bacterium]
MNAVVPAIVDIFLTGRPHWRGPAGEGWLARVDAAWLSLLALSAQQPRDRVAAWIWPDAALRSANTTLRQRIFKLRQAIGHPLVESGAVLRLAPGVRADLLAPGTDDEELLGGFDYGDLEAFESWLTGQRQVLGRRRAEQWSGDAARLEVRGELAAALVIAERIVACQPTLEHGWRRLIRLHYLRGDRSAAIAAFDRFEREVCREIGVRPAPETQALLALVERAATAPSGLLAPLPVSLSRPPRLVGREECLQVMAQAWHDGRAVVIRGESGIGKSRLAEAFLADRPGSLWVGLRASGSSMPYAATAALLAAAFERFVPMVDDAARPELARLLPTLGQRPRRPRIRPSSGRLLCPASRRGAMAGAYLPGRWASCRRRVARGDPMVVVRRIDPGLALVLHRPVRRRRGDRVGAVPARGRAGGVDRAVAIEPGRGARAARIARASGAFAPPRRSGGQSHPARRRPSLLHARDAQVADTQHDHRR